MLSPFLRPLTLFACLLLPVAAVAQTGTFLDRFDTGDLRVVSYNIYFGSIFTSSANRQKFSRVVSALQPDVLMLQEAGRRSSTDMSALMDSIAPLPNGESWHALGGDNAIVSRFPLSLTASSTTPPASTTTDTGLALVDLPDERFDVDLYLVNNHFSCCNDSEPPGPLDPREVIRQRQADAVVNWMRDAKTAGENIDLPAGTPMIVAGDLNIINEPDVLDPLGTLITGDIYHESLFGSDAAPDWDGSPLEDALPRHNRDLVEDYTWRDDSQPYDPGRLDYVLYTDSVMQMGNRFVLNTVAMSSEERQATGLEELDVTVDQDGLNYDHLPVVVDFRNIGQPPMPGDYNDDGRVDAADYSFWRNNLGQPAGVLWNDPTGKAIGMAQYDLWRGQYGQQLSPTPGQTPVPAPGTLALICTGLILSGRQQKTPPRVLARQTRDGAKEI